MPFSLAYGRRIYDFCSRHPRSFAGLRWLVCLGRESEFQRFIIDGLNLEPGQTVLDLSCGNGINFKHLYSRIQPRGSIIALDYSPGMLASAQKLAAAHGWLNIQFIQADAAQYQLPANSLDAAVCSFGLSAIPDAARAIQNVARALKPGANFVVFDAEPFTGPARVFNPIVCPSFTYIQNWNPKKGLLQIIAHNFNSFSIHRFNASSIFIAVATKEG
jgi:phosphatidylethanolamine/phosphatidyl-N-methylethanolamine N-methyltransferase